MRIFVTGASGFIGRPLLNRLGGHEVAFLTRQRPDRLAAPTATAIIGDLDSPRLWSSQLEEFSPQCCVHLAWEGLPDYSDEICRRNLTNGLNLIDLLSRIGVGRVVVAGSCWEYGAATGPVAETHTPVDCGLFAATKHKLREALAAAAAEREFSYRWARVFFAYGPGQRRSSLIPQCWAALQSGATLDIRRPRVAEDFIHVDDVADGLVALAECDIESGIYNLGHGTPVAVGEVVNRVAGHFGTAPPFANAGFDSGFWANMEKMTAATGWRPHIGLPEGIGSTLRALEAA